MTRAEFQDLVDIHGTDLAAWPQQARAAAERHLSGDPAARAHLAAACRMDDLIVRSLRASPGSADAATGRVLSALARDLPRQRRFALTWPAALLDVDLAPSRLRLAALAAVAGLGILLGLLGPDVGPGDGGFALASATGETNLAAMFEPEPLTGARP